MTDKLDSDDKDAGQGNSKSNETKPDPETKSQRPKEIGGRDGLDPTRYGDWEKNGRCIDF